MLGDTDCLFLVSCGGFSESVYFDRIWNMDMRDAFTGHQDIERPSRHVMLIVQIIVGAYCFFMGCYGFYRASKDLRQVDGRQFLVTFPEVFLSLSGIWIGGVFALISLLFLINP